MTGELGITTLNTSELLMQFRLMRALGYHSLFDPEFQKEIRNPLRRLLYYKLLTAESLMSQHQEYQLLKTHVDRLSFFTDPQLYRKVKEQEELDNLADPDVRDAETQKRERAFEQAKTQRRQMTEQEQQEVVKILNRNN